MAGDEYRRGEQVEKLRQREPPVNSLYRPVVLLIWLTGIPILLAATYLFGPFLGLVVIAVVHIFVGGMIFADIRHLRSQGLNWGMSRHLWFGAGVGLPLVGPVYYLYAKRRIDAENRARGYDVSKDGPLRPSDKIEEFDETDADDAGDASDD